VRGYAVSVSPDGRKIIYNSELWKDDPIHYLDEELLQADLLTGVGVSLTREPGNQYGTYAKGGHGEYVMVSNTTPGGARDIFLATSNKRLKLDVADPTNAYDDYEADWWKPTAQDSMITGSQIPICPGDAFKDVDLTFSNPATVPYSYSYYARGFAGVGGPPGATYNVDGPTQIQYLNVHTNLQVPGSLTTTVKLRIWRPAGLVANGLVAGYVVTATNLFTNRTFSTVGSLIDKRPICP
jgi:hypothetical protein